MAFGLNKFSEELSQSALQSGSNEQVATNLGYTLQGWLATNIYPILIGAVVVCTLLAVFYGAFLYFTAYGDESRAQLAKKSMTAGFVGLFIALAAFGITAYVRQNLISREKEQELYKNSNYQAGQSPTLKTNTSPGADPFSPR